MNNLGMRLEIRQVQKLMMTPVLQQAIKMLQLSKLDLQELVQQEMEINPVLDIETPESEQPEESQATAETDNTEQGDYPDDFDWQAYFNDEYNYNSTTSQKGLRDEDQTFSWESVLANHPSLLDHLTGQLQLCTTNAEEAQVGEQIIANLDEAGYLKLPVAELVELTGAKQEIISNVLKLVQSCEPAGIAARSLEECLLLQLDEDTPDRILTKKIIQLHLFNLEKRKYAVIARKLKSTEEHIRKLCDYIRSLDPKPGLRYSSEQSFYVVPDVQVYKLDGEYVISVNDEGIPRLKVSSLYKKILCASKGGEEKKFIEDKMRSALWLIKNINQRQSTLYRVTKSIVERQKEFFDRGIDYIKPLILKDIALEVGLHESTISRITSNKYMHSPRGTFELKYFFHSGVATIHGGTVSSVRIKNTIKQLVAAENPAQPLTDEQIALALEKQDMAIARRTVSKYRQAISVPPASKRRRQ